MKLGFKIAVRFLKSSLGQTILIIMGIAIGVSVQIFIGSLIQGLQKSLVNKTVGSSSHITITMDSNEEQIEDYEALIEKIDNIARKSNLPIKVISPADDNAALIKYSDNTQSILMRGLVLEKADQIYHIQDRMVEGRMPRQQDEIIVGINLKDELSLALEDVVSIITSSQEEKECTIVGFYDLEVASINKSWIFTTKETTNQIFETEGMISSIEIQVNQDNVFEADRIADTLASEIDRDFQVENWKEQNQQLLSGLSGQSVSSGLIQVFVMISVLLGIASVLAITVLQKSKQIGI